MRKIGKKKKKNFLGFDRERPLTWVIPINGRLYLAAYHYNNIVLHIE